MWPAGSATPKSYLGFPETATRSADVHRNSAHQTSQLLVINIQSYIIISWDIERKMDPFIAISLVENILQFVDTTNQAYRLAGNF